jgi:hypothetical protein
MHGTTRARTALIAGFAAVGIVGGGAVAYAAVTTTAVTTAAVDHVCKTKGKTSVYYEGACKDGDYKLTFKGLVGKTGAKGLPGTAGAQGIAGATGAQGPKGDPGDASGFVRVCKTVTVNADYVNGTTSERTIKIEALPLWTDFAGPGVQANGDLVSSNLRAVRDSLGTPGLTVTATNTPTDGSTVRYFEVTGGLLGVTGTETAQLAVCVGRMGVQVG